MNERRSLQLIAEKYQSIHEASNDNAKTGFDRFAEVYEKINTAVKTIDRLYKEYNEEIEPFRDRFRPDRDRAGRPGQFAAAINSFQKSFKNSFQRTIFFFAIKIFVKESHCKFFVKESHCKYIALIYS